MNLMSRSKNDSSIFNRLIRKQLPKNCIFIQDYNSFMSMKKEGDRTYNGHKTSESAFL